MEWRKWYILRYFVIHKHPVQIANLCTSKLNELAHMGIGPDPGIWPVEDKVKKGSKGGESSEIHWVGMTPKHLGWSLP